MSLLNPVYMLQAQAQGVQPQAQAGKKKRNNKNKNKAGGNAGIAFVPATQYSDLRGGTFLNLDAYSTTNPEIYQTRETGPALYTNMTQGGQVGGVPQIDFSQDLGFGGGKGKRARNDNMNAPKKKKKGGFIVEPFKPGERATIFLGGLTPNCEERDLWDLFNQSEIPLKAVRKKYGKPFGHIDLQNPKDLNNVLSMNGLMFMGCALRLEKSSASAPTPALSTEGKDVRTLFIANLAASVNEELLQENFPDCDEVRLPVDRYGNHTGYAFLKYNNQERVKELIEKHQGQILEGNAMILDYAAGKSSAHRGPTESEKDPKNLFVGNLDPDVQKDDIAKLFPDAREVRFPNDSKTSYCFVRFDTEEAAKSAKISKQGVECGGKQLIIDYAAAKQKREKDKGEGSGGTKIIVVKNMSFKTNEVRLRQEFPTVDHIRMVYFPGSDRPKGYAFLEFTCVDDTDDAYNEINQEGKTVDGRVLIAEYALEKGSKAFKERGSQLDDERLMDSHRKSLWGPQGMAYEGFMNEQGHGYQGAMPMGGNKRFGGPSGAGFQGNSGWDAGWGDNAGYGNNDNPGYGNSGNARYGNSGNARYGNSGNAGYGNSGMGAMGQDDGGYVEDDFDIYGNLVQNQGFKQKKKKKQVEEEEEVEYVDAPEFGADMGLPMSFTGRVGEQEKPSKPQHRQQNRPNNHQPNRSRNTPADLTEEARNSGWGYKPKPKETAVGFGEISAKAKASGWGTGSSRGGRGGQRGGGQKRYNKQSVEEGMEVDDGSMGLPFSFTGRTGKK